MAEKNLLTDEELENVTGGVGQTSKILSGEVVDILPNMQIRVELSNGCVITATLSGKSRMDYAKILVGNKVDVELSPYDMAKGNIVSRY